MRRWQLKPTQPLALQLAADARLSATDYTDDQVWELSLGALESPALVLQTRFGGRVGLASLLPMWVFDGRTIYQAQAYAKPPVLTGFAPGYLQAEASLTPTLTLQAEYWAMESHAVGGRFTLRNSDKQPVTLRLNLFGHVGAGGKELPLTLLRFPEGGAALRLGKIGSLNPVVVLENGQDATENVLTPKIGADITLAARGKIAVRWVHTGLPDANQSLALAQQFLAQNWTTPLKRIADAVSIPVIETGDEETDAAIAFSYQQLMQSFMKPTASLPFSSFVAARQPERGFSPRGDGTDHPRSWSGQNPTIAYLTALAVAPVDGSLAQGIIRNYLAVLQNDGWIDWKPGLAGQRQGVMCLPILGRLAWSIFQYTEDTGFVRDVFPGLLKFFDRWFQKDLDTDGDGLPEWQSETQTGYAFMPTFAVNQSWGQAADIRYVETPDMAAYLLSEAMSLREMAFYLRESAAEQRLQQMIDSLKAALEGFWKNGRYTYRDRDTHTTTGSVVILEDGRGNEEHLPVAKISPANRLIVRVTGGLEHIPKMSLRLDGLDAAGKPVSETSESKDFVWGTTRGVYTSRSVFSQLDRVRFEGLVGVYRVRVQTVDTTGLDINALLPLWSVGAEHVDELVRLLTDPAQFWRKNGVAMCSARDSRFDPAGSGSIWPFWLTLIGEGLIEAGHAAEAADLLDRLLAVQVAVLREKKAFSEFYHSDEPRGLGEEGHLAGIVPLHLLLRVLGVRIMSASKVWTGGEFAWGKPVTVSQRGVTVRRSSDGTQVKFPSGQTINLPPNAPWQEVINPSPPAPRPRKRGEGRKQP